MNTPIVVLNGAGQWFVGISADMLIQASVLIGVLFILDWFFRRRMRGVIRYWIWTLLLVKLVLPPSLISPVGLGRLIPKVGTVTATVIPDGPPTLDSKKETLSFNLKSTSPLTYSEFLTSDSQSSVPHPLTEPSINNQALKLNNQVPLSWQGLALLIWVGVVSAMCLLLIQRVLFVKGLVSQAIRCDNALQTVLDACRERLGLAAPVTLKLTPISGSPAVCGLRRPVILMPRDMLANLAPQELEAVLLHELGHVIRGDLWINVVQTLLQILYFYNPLVWLANWQIRKIREIAVDEAVLVALRDRAATYPETLVGVARMALSRPTPSLRLIGVVENKSQLNRRVKRMLTRPLPKIARLGATGIVILALLALLLPMATGESSVLTMTNRQIVEALTELGVDPNDYHTVNVKYWWDGLDLDSGQVVNIQAARVRGVDIDLNTELRQGRRVSDKVNANLGYPHIDPNSVRRILTLKSDRLLEALVEASQRRDELQNSQAAMNGFSTQKGSQWFLVKTDGMQVNTTVPDQRTPSKLAIVQLMAFGDTDVTLRYWLGHWDPSSSTVMVHEDGAGAEGRASLHGIVIDPNGRPAGNHRFWINKNSKTLASVTTGTTGQFTIEDVPLGLLQVACQDAYGHEVAYSFPLDRAGPWYIKLLYNSEPNKTYTLKVLALGREPGIFEKSADQPWYDASGETSIRGRVLDAQGAPVTHAVVVLCESQGGIPLVKESYVTMTEAYISNKAPREIAFEVTNESGQFRFDHVPDGTYRLIAQSWQGVTKIKAILETNGPEIQLHGLAEHVRPGRDVEIRPLGSGTLVLDQHMPNDETLLVVSTSPPQADPVLGFAGWGGPLMRHMICGNRMPAGKTTIHGLPAGTVYLAMFAADSAPAFAAGRAEIRAGQNTVLPEIQFVGSWSNARQEPPAALQAVFSELQQLGEDQLKYVAQQLYNHMGMTGESQGGPWAFMSLAQPHLKETFILPGDKSVTFEQCLSCLMYLQLQRQVERRQPKQTQASDPVDASRPAAQSELQARINAARPGDTVVISEGTYTQPVRIDKPLTVRGSTRDGCVFQVTANEPAILIDTQGQGTVTLENVTVQWQLATSDRKTPQPFALGIKDTKAMIRGCRFVPLGTPQRSPVALRADGFSEVTVADCRFTGFEYTVCFGKGVQAQIVDSVVINGGHQGVTGYENSNLTVARCIVSGFDYHGIRCTGGTLTVRDSLIADVRRCGIYLGNKNSQGTISNCAFLSNATGVAGYYISRYDIKDNVFLASSQSGIGAWDTCQLTVEHNIFQDNAKAIVVYAKEGSNGNVIRANTFWQNETDTENCTSPESSLTQNPLFASPGQGDYSLLEGSVKTGKHGLTHPEIIRQLWVKYQAAVH
ncbi:MAG: right-handed parallel beta-helix repeat-containing protein [Phycisphaerae bacterium]|nr:right-handed parallel beta-helix repeat-containing protein [Phycisphaerae bacterium]